MQFKTIFRILGILLMIFSISMLTPILINLAFHETFTQPFLTAFTLTFLSGFLLWYFFQHTQKTLKIRDGFLLVVLFWLILCAFGALPYFLMLHPMQNHITNALFESVSGFTTTGASVIEDLGTLPHAILFYRQQSQFLGGMGIIVLAVAIMPVLGVGGMQLYRAETPGPMKDTKFTPRIAQTAKVLWCIYTAMTVICLLCYWIGGMNWFDALGESFSTVSTGGFSMHNDSFMYYDNVGLEMIACFFMIAGSCNFALHYLAYTKKNLWCYLQDEECRQYLILLCLCVLFISLCLSGYHVYQHYGDSLSKSAFNVISLATTTGYIAAPFASWPTFIPLLMISLSLIGGCGGSTCGGIKFVRALLLAKQSKQEMVRLLHPNAVLQIKFGHQPLSDPILQAMWAFLSVFLALYFIILLCLMAFGNDFQTAFSAASAALANAGAGIGAISDNFTHMNTASKWILMFAMIAGRLEIFSLLILFTKQFWES